MTNESADSEMQADEEVDPGEPIAMLAEFVGETPSGFLPRVRRAIQRRDILAQLASFAAGAPLVVLREFWVIFHEQLNPKAPRKDNSHGKKIP